MCKQKNTHRYIENPCGTVIAGPLIILHMTITISQPSILALGMTLSS